MRVLVLGSGAREHALCLALAADPAVTALVCAPGNAGTATVAEQRGVDPLDGAAVAALATRMRADLVVVGPEAPLVSGVADAVRTAGIDCFGPSQAAARLEGSKAFAKAVMASAGVPTAAARVCTDRSQVAAALDEFGPPYVVKDDGLAAGKGVVVTDDRDAALDHAALVQGAPVRGAPVHTAPVQGARHGSVVVEEYLDGPEVSLFCLTDGEAVVPLLAAQDFKRVGDGDTGPNTGGMGAYAPLPWLPAGFTAEVVRTVARPTVQEMARRGTPFAGLLYIGLALTARGPRVVEFNARFGDPETQVVLALLENPLGGLLRAVATGTLAAHPPLRWGDAAAVTVVMAASGYPESPRAGDVITGAEAPGVIHAGTRRRDDGAILACGGRVLSVTATGSTLVAARAAAYALLATIEFPGGHYRHDIALQAVRGEISV